MITVSTQQNVDGILLAVIASEGQAGFVQFMVDSRCLLRGVKIRAMKMAGR